MYPPQFNTCLELLKRDDLLPLVLSANHIDNSPNAAHFNVLIILTDAVFSVVFTHFSLYRDCC